MLSFLFRAETSCSSARLDDMNGNYHTPQLRKVMSLVVVHLESSEPEHSLLLMEQSKMWRSRRQRCLSARRTRSRSLWTRQESWGSSSTQMSSSVMVRTHKSVWPNSLMCVQLFRCSSGSGAADDRHGFGNRGRSQGPSTAANEKCAQQTIHVSWSCFRPQPRPRTECCPLRCCR